MKLSKQELSDLKEGLRALKTCFREAKITLTDRQAEHLLSLLEEQPSSESAEEWFNESPYTTIDLIEIDHRELGLNTKVFFQCLESFASQQSKRVREKAEEWNAVSENNMPPDTKEVLVWTTSQAPYKATWNGKEWRSGLDHYNGIKWVRGLQPEDVLYWMKITPPNGNTEIKKSAGA